MWWPDVGLQSPLERLSIDSYRYTYEELAGYGFILNNTRDKYGDTIGGIGSSIAIDSKTWARLGQGYTGVLYTLPDRG